MYVSILECVAAGGHSDRCGTCVAQLHTREGKSRGERNITELPEEMRLRSWVCQGGLGEGNSTKKIGQTHVTPFAVFAKFSLLEQQQRRNETLYPEPEFIIFKKLHDSRSLQAESPSHKI